MMRFNILHRTGAKTHYGILRRQQELAHRLGLKTTLFLYYEDLFNEEILADARRDQQEFGDEIALSLHGLRGPGVSEISNGLGPIWLLDRERKEKVLTIILGKYREVFGCNPTSVGAYHFDSSSLALLRKHAPEARTIIGGCFEEGVRVFHGCNHSWYLFNEGMPWNPWHPSKSHSLRPAADDADAAGVVAVPHLLRDMSLAFEGRNDFWASHPPNVIRGMGNDASFCPYDLNLVDQFRMQEEWNGGHSYYNTFVSPSWLDWNHNSEYPPEVAWELYTKFLTYMADLKSEGALEDLTLSEYGDWHRAHRPPGDSEVFFAKEMLYGSGKHYFWHIDTHLRATVDATQGGSIGDLRPYAGRVPVATGPDTPHRDIGSYPYVIQSQHRSGAAHHCFDGARTTLLVTHGKETLDLCNFRCRVSALSRTQEGSEISLSPVHLTFASGVTATLVTSYRFANGTIEITREVSEISDPSATLELTEYFKGAPGRTEYPEDLHGIVLTMNGDAPCETDYDYSGEWHSSESASKVSARIPQVNSEISLETGAAKASASFCAGHLFSPFFTLKLTQHLTGNGTTRTCLITTPIAM
jgi:hypothetical protein